MNSQDFRNLQEAYNQVYELDENRMASRMEKMPTAPAKVGKATHSIKDLATSKPPTPEEKAKARKALGLNEISNAKVAAVSKARQNNVNKAFDKLDDSRVSSQNLATAISKQQKNQRLSSKRDKRNEEVDLYDIILSHLLDEGYADTYESAERIMVNMSEEWRDSIIETRLDPRGRPASGPMNVYANPKKPSQAHLDAVKAYDEKQKKKTPEQRKAELDAYRNRKMYS
jgi:hypothetical protein